MDGRQVPGGLTRSVDGFDAVVRRYSELPFGGRPPEGQPGLLGLVSRTLAVSTGGLDGPGPVSAMRLVAALELVRPSRVSLLAESVDGEALQVIRVEGLSPEGVTMALTPHHDLLMARLEAPDALLGACLLREVARGGRGEVRSRSPGTLDLVCRV